MYGTPVSWLGKALGAVPKIASQVAVSLAATALIAWLTHVCPGLRDVFRTEPARAEIHVHEPAKPAVASERPAEFTAASQGVTWFGRPVHAVALLPLTAAEPSREPAKPAEHIGKQAGRKPRAQAAAHAGKPGLEVLPAPRPARPAEAEPEPEGPTLLGMPLPGLDAGKKVFRAVASLGSSLRSGLLIDRIAP